MAAEEEFQVVKKRKARRQRLKQNTPGNRPSNIPKEPALVSEQEKERLIAKIQSCRDEIQISEFWANVKDVFSLAHSPKSDCDQRCVARNFVDIVCYGIGKLTDCPTARYQFALLLLMKDFLQIPGKCFIFEPCFTKDDESIVKQFDITLIDHNEEGKRQVQHDTLFVMIHCGKALYNGLLWANWGQNLSKVCLLGNRFSSYQERLPSRQLANEAMYISRILPYTHEAALPNSFHLRDIFNDTALHSFNVENTPTFEWADCPEPMNDKHDPEIITQAAT